MTDLNKISLSELETYYNLCFKMLEQESHSARMNPDCKLSSDYNKFFAIFEDLKIEIKKRLMNIR